MPHIFINTNRSLGTIDPNIYGQFSEHLGRCIYQGIYVGESAEIPNINGMRCDVVNALKALHIPVLRWPGGCFADTYHWRDGIGPQAQRKTIVNTNWGGVSEDNSFGTHEFMELTRQLGCEAYFSGNVGSGTVQEFSDWVEYCNMGGVSPMASLRRENGREAPFHVKYWGIGNEAWGCGGSMRAEYYADLCRQYSTYLRNYSPEHKIFKIASGANVADYHWTKTVMERAGQAVDALAELHAKLVDERDVLARSVREHHDDRVRAVVLQVLERVDIPVAADHLIRARAAGAVDIVQVVAVQERAAVLLFNVNELQCGSPLWS